MKYFSIVSSLLLCPALVAQQSPAPSQSNQPLSLQDAVQIAISNNLQVQIAEEGRAYTKAGLMQAQGTFDWTLSSNLMISSQEFPDTLTDRNPQKSIRNLSIDLSKPFEWGGKFEFGYDPKRVSQKSYLLPSGPNEITPNPYSGGLTATYTQSLLRGFGRDAAATHLIVAQRQSKIADLDFQKQIIDLVANTESLYWDMVYAQRNLGNKQQALELAQRQLRENQVRVEVGTLAPIEVTSAEAQVALRQQDIISAEADLFNSQDALLRHLFPNAKRPAALELTTAPEVRAIDMEDAKAEQIALDKRLELKSAQLSFENTQLQEKAAKNYILPKLDAFATYNGGSANHTSLGSVNSNLTGMDYPGYQVGLTFAMSIPNRAAKAGLIQARAKRRSSELSLQDLQLGISLEVRTALRNVKASEKGVKAAETTRIFRQKDYEAEQKKYENGMSTNFHVLSKQNDLDDARSSELRAQITYAKALTNLERALGNLLEARNITVK